jgi:GWxTD domain-containing protein
MIFLLFMQIEYQAISRTISDSHQQLVIYLTIPSHELQYIARDDDFYARYEIQLTVYDERDGQLTGDYWRREILEDSAAIKDSVKLNISKNSFYYILKIYDLNGGELLAARQQLIHVKNLGNLFWKLDNDTLVFTFTIFNQQGIIDSMQIAISEMQKTIKVRRGTYSDSVIFDVAGLRISEYPLSLALYSGEGKIDESHIPVQVSRPFYLDDEKWSQKIAQLQYIASPTEMNILKNAVPEDRDSLWSEFWRPLDPTPNTIYNEKEAEYFERIAYAERKFGNGDRGWRSDRAKIFIKYGPPDEIQSYPYEIDSFPYEIWLYYRNNQRFIFVDRHGFGQYDLVSPEGLGI